MPERSGPLDIKLAGLPFKVMQTPGGRPGAPAKAEYVCKEVEQIRDHFGGGTEPNYGDYPTSVESVYYWDDWSNGLSPTRQQKIDKTYWTTSNVDARRIGQLILGPLSVATSMGVTTGSVIKFVDFAGALYAACGANVLKYSAGTFTSVLSLGGTTNVVTDLVVFNGKLLVGSKGTTKDINIPVPTTAVILGKVATATNLPAGTYTFGYTFATDYGESAIGPTASITIAAGDSVLINGASAAIQAQAQAIAAAYNGVIYMKFYLTVAPAGPTLGFLSQQVATFGASYTYQLASQGNGVGAPSPSITYDNGGANGVGRITDTGKTAWVVNQWTGRLVFAGGALNVVASNTAGVLTMLYPWGTSPSSIPPSVGTAYAIDAYQAYFNSSDGLTYTPFDPRFGGNDGGKVDKFAPVRFQLWKSVLPNKVYSCLDPTVVASNASSWTSTATLIGEATKNITSLSAYITDLAIGKEDGLWSLDRNGNDFPILPEMATVAGPTNCQNMKQWRNGLNLKVRNGFFRYEGSKLESIGLDRYRASGVPSSPLVLTVADAAPYLNELFVALNSGTPAGLIAALLPDPWRWHLYFGTGANVTLTALAVSTSVLAGNKPALFYGYLDGSAQPQISYIALPANTDNPLDDTAYQYAPSGSLLTTEINPLPDQDKVFTMVRLKALDNLLNNGQTSISVEYAVDADIDSLTFTYLIGPQKQTVQTCNPNVAAPSLMEFFFPKPVVGKSIQFRVGLFRAGTTTQTPVVKHLVVHYKHTPQARKRWELGLVCEDRPMGQDHHQDQRTADVQVGQLLALRNSPRTAKSFEDRMGFNWSVFVERVDHELIEKLPGLGDRWICKVTLLEDLATSSPALPPIEAA